MSTISYTINGVPVVDLAQVISSGEGLQQTAPPVGDNVALPGIDGAHDPYQLGQQRRPDGEGRHVLALSMRGVDRETGQWEPGTTLQTYLDNADRMIRLLHGRRLVVDAERPDGSVRRCIAHLAPGESLDFTRERSSPAFGTYLAALAIPSGRWTDPEPVTTGVQLLGTGDPLDLSVFAAATAVCTDLELILGPGANPRIDKADGFVSWDGVIAAGRQLRMFTATGLIDRGPTGAMWVPGYASLACSPGPRYLEIDPSQPLQGTFSHTGGGAMSVEVRGPRHYRTP